MRILVTGSTGLLGSRLVPYLLRKGYDVVTHGMTKLADYNVNLCQPIETYEFLDELKPDLIIHLVCLSNVDICEENKDLAYRLNVLTTENVTQWLSDNKGSKLVFISTDHVYDGCQIHTENNVTIRNMYAFSKYCAEIVATKVNSIILRVNFFGKSFTKERISFSDWVKSSLINKNKVILLTDVFISPLSLETLTEMILLSGLSEQTGVFNLGSKDGASKRDIAHLIAGRMKLDTSTAKDGVQANLNLKAVRPSNMIMDVTKFEKTFGVNLPNITDEILNAEL